MISWLATATMLTALLAAAWCFVAAGRDRFLDRSHLVALSVVAALVVVQTVVAIVRMAGGERPEEFATFVGYLLTAVLTVPAGVSVAYMEKTRWGSVIAGSASLVLAVLVLRLVQVWTPLQ